MCTRKRSVETGNKPKGERFETTAVVRIVVVAAWKYDNEDDVFSCQGVRSLLMYRDVRSAVVQTVHLDQHVVLVTCLS